MAPAEPSGQDRAVAAQAMQVMLQAQSELAAGEGEADDSRNIRSREAEDIYRSVSAMDGNSGNSDSVTSLFA